MAKRYSIHRSNDADKRTALLGLALSGSNDEEGSCLSDEEMAALVDGACSTEEGEQYLLHLANCSGCYQHWVELSKIVRFDKKRNKDTTHKVFRPRFIVWAGSFLAAAASVVLFLNITSDAPSPIELRPMKTMVTRKSTLAPELQKDSTAKKSMPVEAGNGKRRDSTVYGVRLPDTVSSSASAMKMTDHDAEDYIQPQSTATKNKLRTSGESHAVNIRRSQATAIKKSRLPSRLWLDRVKQGCLHHETSRQFWVKQYREGRRFIASLDPVEKQLIQELLPLVDDLQQGGGERQDVCGRILKRFKAIPSK